MPPRGGCWTCCRDTLLNLLKRGSAPLPVRVTPASRTVAAGSGPRCCGANRVLFAVAAEGV